MEREKFSYYRPPIGLAVIPTATKTLGDIYQQITTNPALQTATENLREILNTQGEDSYRTEKTKSLPSVTFGGVFDYRHSDPERLLEETRRKLETETDPEKEKSLERKIQTLSGKKGLLSLSGYLVIDIDHISQTGVSLEELRDRLSQDREIGLRLIFVSPSGDGLKLVCKTSSLMTDSQSYKGVFEALRHYINTNYSPSGEIVDRSGSDITRLCLLPFDKEAVLREWEDTFSAERHPVPRPERPSQREDYSRSKTGDSEDGVEEIVRRVEESGIDIAPDYQDFLKLGYVFAQYGEEGREYYKRICRVHINRGGYNITEEEINSQFDKCRGGYGNIGTLIEICKDMGINVYDYNNKRGGLPYQKGQSSHSGQAVLKTAKEDTPEESPEEKYRKYLEIPDLRDVMTAKREGIKTGYLFRNTQGREETLTLPSGALTIVCGQSSHGKTRFLQNISLSLAKDLERKGEEGEVLFFAFEEDYSEIALQFANLSANIPQLSKYGTDNTEVLRDYYKTGRLNKAVETKRQTALSGLSQFEGLQKEGRLRIYYTPDTFSGDLCKILEYLSSKIPIKAVFMDYVQAIYKEGYRKDRREELREICKELNNTAKSLDIPIVLSAQLNRDTPNPTSISSDNIAESADITRYANIVLCLWNSAFINDLKDKDKYLESKDYSRIKSKGFVLGEPGKLYCLLTKNRGGIPYPECILSFDGDTGKISENDDLPPGDTGEDKTSGGKFSGEFFQA